MCAPRRNALHVTRYSALASTGVVALIRHPAAGFPPEGSTAAVSNPARQPRRALRPRFAPRSHDNLRHHLPILPRKLPAFGEMPGRRHRDWRNNLRCSTRNHGPPTAFVRVRGDRSARVCSSRGRRRRVARSTDPRPGGGFALNPAAKLATDRRWSPSVSMEASGASGQARPFSAMCGLGDVMVRGGSRAVRRTALSRTSSGEPRSMAMSRLRCWGTVEDGGGSPNSAGDDV